jgi:hypothetical protein
VCKKIVVPENLKERDNLEDLDVDMSKGNIKTDVNKMGCEGMDWIKLAQDKVYWRFMKLLA